MKLSWLVRKQMDTNKRDSILVVFSHATGFCKETWLPVIDSLFHVCQQNVTCLAVDLLGHGDSSKFQVPNDDIGKTFGNGLLKILDNFQLDTSYQRVLGVGHSIGGTALINAELDRPGTFSDLLLLEPILFPPVNLKYERFEKSPLSLRTEKRTAVYENRQAAYDNLRTKPVFQGWTEECFELYLSSALKTLPDKKRELKCIPQQEAEVYRCATPAFGRLSELTGPKVSLVVGSKSDHIPLTSYNDMISMFPKSIYDKPLIFEGCSHFVPMENPKAVADEILKLVNFSKSSRL